MLSCRTAFGLCRVVTFPNIRGSGLVGSVGYWVGSRWVKKFRLMYISETDCNFAVLKIRGDGPL